MRATTLVSNSLGAKFLIGQNKGLIKPGDANPPQIFKLCDAERRFVPRIGPLACYAHLQNCHINELELFTILLALRQWGIKLSNKRIVNYTENAGTDLSLTRESANQKKT